MLNTQDRYNGAFIGHTIVSNYDLSITLVMSIIDSLFDQTNSNLLVSC